MSNIENRVVALTFDNAQFERGIEETLASMERLRAGIENIGDNQGFASIQAGADSVNLAGLAASVDNIQGKFSALGAVAFTVLQDLTRTAVDIGKRIGSAIIDPIIQGGRARSLAIEQAKFQFRGLGMDVEASMQSATDAVTGTAYGLDAAAGIAAQFGASGIRAGDQLTGALRGVAGVAAMTNSSFQDIGQIFAQVAAQGKLTGASLYSFSARNMNMAAALAEQWGVTEAAVRQMAANGEIDFHEFAAAADAAFGEHATSANQTYTGALANLRSAMSRVGEVFATPSFAGLRVIFNALSPAIDRVKASLLPLVDGWKSFVFQQGIKSARLFENFDTSKLDAVMPHVSKIFMNLFRAIKSFIAPIKEAFRDIFPAKSAEQLEDIARSIQRFTKHLKLSGETSEKLKSIFSGVFAVISIGIAVIKGIVGVIVAWVQAMSPVTGGFLSLGAGIGNALVRLKEFLVDGGRISDFFADIPAKIKSFFDSFKDVGFLEGVGNALGKIKDAITGIFDGASGGKDPLGRIKDRVGPLGTAVAFVGDKIQAVIGFLGRLKDVAENVFGRYIDVVKKAGSALLDAFDSGNFSAILDFLNVVLAGGFVLAFKKIADSFENLTVTFDVGGGFLSHVTGSFDALTNTLTTMQTEIKARALLKIAQAVALLTISVVALSLIDSGALTKALTGMAVGFGQLVAAFAILDVLATGPTAAAKVSILAGGLILLAGAMIVMSFAVRSMATLSLGDLAKGLVGVGTALGIMVIAVKPLAANSGGMILASLGLVALSISLLFVSKAVKSFSELDWGELARGLVGAGAALIGISLAMRLMPPGIIAQAAGLILLGIGMLALSGAIKMFASIEYASLAQGLVGVGGALIVVAGAMTLMPPNMLASAAALFVVGASLAFMSSAIKSMAALSWEELGRGLVGLAGGLTVLVVAANTMSGGLVGALAIGVMAVSLGALAAVVMTFSAMEWGDLGKGILGLSLALAAIAAVSLLLAPAAPAIAAVGLALVALGAAVALFGVGVSLIASGFAVLADVTPKAMDSVMDGLRRAITILPDLATELAEGLIAFVQTIVEAAPQLMEGFSQITMLILEKFVEMAPQFQDAFIALIDLIITTVNERAPQLIATGLFLLVSFLQGIRDNIGQVTMLVAEIIINFLNALTPMMPMIITAGSQLLISFLYGIASNMGRIIQAGVTVIVSFLNGIAANIGRIVTAGVGIIVSFLNGIANNIGRIIQAGVNIIVKFLEGIRSASHQITEAAFKLVINLVNDLANSIDKHSGEMRSAGLRLAGAIIDGMTGGIRSGASSVVNSIRDMASNAINSAKGILGINSPSRVFRELGSGIVEGFVMGVDSHSDAIKSIDNLGTDTVNAFTKITDDIAASMQNLDLINPTITPVLDLTGVTKDAKQLASIFGTAPFVANVSSGQARSISNDVRRQDTFSSQASRGGSTEVKFEQNIYAPEALSVSDIYRNTRSQINIAKEELGIL